MPGVVVGGTGVGGAAGERTTPPHRGRPWQRGPRRPAVPQCAFDSTHHPPAICSGVEDPPHMRHTDEPAQPKRGARRYPIINSTPQLGEKMRSMFPASALPTRNESAAPIHPSLAIRPRFDGGGTLSRDSVIQVKKKKLKQNWAGPPTTPAGPPGRAATSQAMGYPFGGGPPGLKNP